MIRDLFQANSLQNPVIGRKCHFRACGTIRAQVPDAHLWRKSIGLPDWNNHLQDEEIHHPRIWRQPWLAADKQPVQICGSLNYCPQTTLRHRNPLVTCCVYSHNYRVDYRWPMG
jgi:hypothetical protein